ncbi:Ferredoxin [Bacillus thermotolerans]|uniref:Ferredoxin n=1 Tax=Bacillus thermotolerans TaxID=1221996 RepID=A0A0F5HMB0_BACTR|nr:Ferredoxin [Bacillus thermotolerans]KKB34431.1 Ferredoxin [Bacillus thermotolerans]KKB38175.1 Ferredoxin [Bacillus thermotolerans]
MNVNPIYEECVKACLACMEARNVCYDACLKEENVKMMADCIRTDRECAGTCA